MMKKYGGKNLNGFSSNGKPADWICPTLLLPSKYGFSRAGSFKMDASYEMLQYVRMS